MYETGETWHTEFWSKNLKGKDHLEDLGIDGRILEWMLKK